MPQEVLRGEKKFPEGLRKFWEGAVGRDNDQRDPASPRAPPRASPPPFNLNLPGAEGQLKGGQKTRF